MKTRILTLLLSLSLTTVMAQKFGYVDTDYVLNRMPEYKKAQGEIEKLSTEWEQEIKDMAKEVEGMYAALQAEEVLLTPEMKDQRIEDIQLKEEKLKEYQREVFGFEGLFFLKKQELVKPIQDKVFDAVEKVAKEQRLSVIFDKAADLVMIYTDPRYDYTDFVLDELGLGDPNDVLK